MASRYCRLLLQILIFISRMHRNQETKQPEEEHSPRDKETEYTAIHLDDKQERPKGTAKRFQDSVEYTVADIRQRWQSHDATSGNYCSKLRDSLVKLPDHGLQYTKQTISFYWENPAVFRKELLSGLTVALLQVPESVAFSYVAKLDSSFGLYATVFLGSLTALFGGKPGMISGAAGALAVIVAKLMSTDGPLPDGEYTNEERISHMLMSIIMVGVFQIAFGVLGLAKFVTLIPQTSMIGFLNGLAIIIFGAQLPTFQRCIDV